MKMNISFGSCVVFWDRVPEGERGYQGVDRLLYSQSVSVAVEQRRH